MVLVLCSVLVLCVEVVVNWESFFFGWLVDEFVVIGLILMVICVGYDWFELCNSMVNRFDGCCFGMGYLVLVEVKLLLIVLDMFG